MIDYLLFSRFKSNSIDILSLFYNIFFYYYDKTL